MTTEALLKKEGIIKYKGKLIIPCGTYFYTCGKHCSSVISAKARIDDYQKPDFRPKKFIK